MGIERTVNRSSNFPTLRARDLPFAFAMQLLLTTATLCSVLWLWLSNDGLISTRLSMPKEISTKFLVDINQATSPETIRKRRRTHERLRYWRQKISCHHPVYVATAMRLLTRASGTTTSPKRRVGWASSLTFVSLVLES